jgi:hypothetical protein
MVASDSIDIATGAGASALLAAAGLRIACNVQQPPGGSACSNSINWSAGPGLPPTPSQGAEAVNGLNGLRMGANAKRLSRKHRSHLSKAEFFHAFLELCAHAPPATLPPRLIEAIERARGALTYRQLKEAALEYQQAKRAFLRADGPFGGWMRSPHADCFVDDAEHS